MKKLLYTTILIFITVAANAQFGTITFNQDTVIVMRRLKLLNVQVGATTDSLITHKANSNIGKLHMNQLIIPYANLTGAPTIPSYSAGPGISIVGSTVTNTQPDQILNLSGGAGVSVTGVYPNFTISLVPPVINNAPGRLVNTNFTVSTTKSANVLYTVNCTVTNPLLAGSSTATAFLEYSLNAGSTWQSATQSSNLSSVGLTVSLQLTSTQSGVIGGFIPANALVRIRTVTAGIASVSLLSSGQMEMTNSI